MFGNAAISRRASQFYFFRLYFSALLLQNVLSVKFAITESFQMLHPKQKHTARLMGTKIR